LKNKRNWILLLCLLGLLINKPALAQNDSLRLYDIPSFPFAFKFDGKYSFINNEFFRFWGFKLGCNLNKYHQVGIGYSFMPFNEAFSYTQGDSVKIGRDYLRYFQVFYEPKIYAKHRIEVSLPLNFGYGKVGIEQKNSGGLFLKKVGIIEPNVLVLYRFYRYISFGGGIGYRQMLTDDVALKKSFSAVSYQVKLRLDLMTCHNEHRRHKHNPDKSKGKFRWF